MIVFTVVYYIIGAINLLTGALGMISPFGILGDFTLFYSDALGVDETELLTVHLARMCQTLAFGMGLLFVLLRGESQRVRAILLAVNSITAIWYSLGEILFDAPRAQRLGLDWPAPEKVQQYSRPIQFLIGALDGGSAGAAFIAVVGLLVSILAYMKANDDPSSKKTA
ncbi:expressed unknown protein [Seminavis robusta]|uniref:Uncharacterized protein n=1 Tax=Seminavis robusta TaxID=568900 RepID=A0A9N8D9M8_9STRA|nr:expressed unknown protein [Seminavis robusta]|eukprot:Sro43_g025960.1 n/a (168) ;mRNA; f:20683-21186